jgi:hypothetical protein
MSQELLYVLVRCIDKTKVEKQILTQEEYSAMSAAQDSVCVVFAADTLDTAFALSRTFTTHTTICMTCKNKTNNGCILDIGAVQGAEV